jgi:hypothetical protein
MQVFCLIGIAATVIGGAVSVVWFIDFVHRFKYIEDCNTAHYKELTDLKIELRRHCAACGQREEQCPARRPDDAAS